MLQPLPEKNRNGILSGYDVIYLDDTQKQIRKHVKVSQQKKSAVKIFALSSIGPQYNVLS